ncbi:hypothetical protein BDK51DRAFT_22478, partial [Blyttiomyces helicus]
QSNTFNQDKEVDRILGLQLQTRNPIELLDLPSTTWTTLHVDTRAVKLSYRKRSLLLHPDKCKHPRAQEAFETLKKAESELMDDEKRKMLVNMIRDSRDLVFRKKGIKIPKAVGEELAEVPDDLPAEVPDLVRLEVRRAMADLENRDKVRLKNEFERRLTEAEQKAEERKRKLEHDKLWEETREERVGNWRKFMKDGVKKKKKRRTDSDVPGMPPS